MKIGLFERTDKGVIAFEIDVDENTTLKDLNKAWKKEKVKHKPKKEKSPWKP
jgi:hypothetical protein